MPIKVQMTYERITPESAEHGEVADHGFIEPGGWEYSIADDSYLQREQEIGRDAALAERRPDPQEFESSDDAIDFLRDYGPFEPSGWPSYDENTWLTQADPSTDWATGEETRLSFHLECNPSDHVDIIKRLCR